VYGAQHYPQTEFKAFVFVAETVIGLFLRSTYQLHLGQSFLIVKTTIDPG